MSTRKIDTVGTTACLSALVFWSLAPIFIKYLAGHLDMLTQNALRYSAACLLWLPFLLFAVKRKTFDHRIWRKALFPAAANITMQCCWAGSFYYLNPAFSVLLNKFSIIWIAGFSLIFFVDERPLLKSKIFWLGMGLSIIGVVGVMLSEENFTATRTLIGITIAMMTAVMWGVYVIAAKIAFKDTDSRHSFSVVSIYTVAGFWVLTLLFGKPSDAVKMSLLPWACVVVSGMLSIGLSHVLYYASMKRIGATIPALILLAQPFTVLAISSVVFGDFLNSTQWIFGIVLLSGSALAIWAQRNLGQS